MNVFARTHVKLAGLTVVATLGLLLGGCSGGDDGNNSAFAGGFTYPAVPSARPTFTGLTAVIDTHGGDGSTGNNGGTAGDVELRALHGRILHGDTRARPPINANALTTTELADNTITYAELLALTSAGVQVFTSTNATIIDLFGVDFFVPSTATLDLSGAPGAITTVAIRTNFAGDVIRIDGNVNGVRLTLDSVGLTLVSEQATGTAINVDGNINLSGYPSSVTYDGGELLIVGFRGAVVVRGTINTSGNSPSVDDGGSGGRVALASDEGDVVAPFGILLLSGGAGVTGGSGGNVLAWASDTETMNFDWAMRTFGGGGTSQGGSGGDIDVNYDGPLNAFCIFEAFSGSATSGSGSVGGDVVFSGLTAQGVVQGSVNGGNGGTGNAGGSIRVEGESVFGLAVEATALGGTGSTGGGGTGGNITVYCDGAALVNILVNAQAHGGQGATSGANGGRIDVGGYGETTNVTVNAAANGGNGGTGSGGIGGSSSFYMDSDYGESITNSTVTATMNGGNGVTGGAGGNFDRGGSACNLAGGQRHDFTLNLNGNGGNGTTGAGGNGGSFRLDLDDLVSANIDLALSFNAGSSATGTSSGTGGSCLVNMANQNSLTFIGGSASFRGGQGTGSAAGGLGGRVDIQGQTGGIFTANTVTWDLRGGDSNTARGGDALNQTNGAFNASGMSQLLLVGGAINAVGGQGSVVSGSFGGGNGGRVTMTIDFGRLLMNSPIDTSGGLGSTSGTGSGAGPVSISASVFDVQITANITSNGQTGNIAGAAGNISIVGDATTSIVISSTIETRGGGSTAVATPVGAVGGNIDIGNNVEAALRLTATAVLRSQGGLPIANSGLIDIDLIVTGTTDLIEDAGSQIIALNGAGTPQAGNIDRNTN